MAVIMFSSLIVGTDITYVIMFVIISFCVLAPVNLIFSVLPPPISNE